MRLLGPLPAVKLTQRTLRKKTKEFDPNSPRGLHNLSVGRPPVRPPQEEDDPKHQLVVFEE